MGAVTTTSPTPTPCFCLSHLRNGALSKATDEGRNLMLAQVVELALSTIRLIRETERLPSSREEVAPAGVLTRLTGRERELAALIGQGRSNKEIAEALIVTKRTVETHIGNILSKLGFTSRAQIVAWAITSGLVKSDR
jgi:DNA-binding NarL/FixJ family response regulator